MRRLFTILVCSTLLYATPALAQTDLVARVKDTLVLQGQTFTTNCDAFEITRRVAWLLRDQGAQLIGKTPAQNGCDFGNRKYSHDAIAFPTGWRDILRNAGPPVNEDAPTWELTGTDPNAPLYAPFDPGGVTDPPPILPPTQPPVVVPEPITSLQEQILTELRQHEAAEAIERVKAEEFRQAVGSEYAKVGKFVGKYILPAVVAFLGGKALAN